MNHKLKNLVQLTTESESEKIVIGPEFFTGGKKTNTSSSSSGSGSSSSSSSASNSGGSSSGGLSSINITISTTGSSS
jgi:uncharacterized membrane protein YgcG